MEAVALLAAIGVLSGKIVDLGKYISNKEWNGVVTQLFAWLAGVCAVVFAANINGAENVTLPGTTLPLGHLSFLTLVFVGLTASSGFSFAYDVKKALDNHDTAAMPSLLPATDPVVASEPTVTYASERRSTTPIVAPSDPAKRPGRKPKG